MNETMEQLKILSKVINTSKIMTPQDVEAIRDAVIHVLAEHRRGTEKMNEESRQVILGILSTIVDRHEAHKKEVDDLVEQKNTVHAKAIAGFIDDINEALAEVRTKIPKDGKDGKNADPNDVVPLVMAQIKLPKNKVVPKLTPVEIADGLESLKEEDRLSADAIEEKSLLSILHRFFKNNYFGKYYSVSGSRFLATLFDVVLSAPTDGQALVYDGANKRWKNGTPGGGSGITFEQPLGTVDGSNVTFTVVNTPKFINVNGAIYGVGQGQYSSLTPGSPNTITLASPVGVGGFIGSYY